MKNLELSHSDKAEMEHLTQKYKDQSKLRSQLKQSYDQACLEVSKQLYLIDLATSVGFAIQNSWITMLMILYGMEPLVDSFIWILPNIIAILIRPYLIRYAHLHASKIRKEATLLVLFMILAGVGCIIVALSTQISNKYFWKRILLCSLGWTITDISYEMALFFKEKIQQSCQNCYQKSTASEEQSKLKGQKEQSKLKEQNKSEEQNKLKEQKEQNKLKEQSKLKGQKELNTSKEQNKSQENSFINYTFVGYLLGYAICIGYCFLPSQQKIKDVYAFAKYAYFSAAFIQIFVGCKLYIQQKLIFSKIIDSDNKFAINKQTLVISYDVNYYLPGLTELKMFDSKSLWYLMLHFCMTFLNDVVVIYATMWLANAKDLTLQKKGQKHLYGLQMGSFYLIIYTIFDNFSLLTKLTKRLKSHVLFLWFEFVLSLIVFSAYYFYESSNFLYYLIGLTLLNHLYRGSVLSVNEARNQLTRCYEIIDRIEKIFVLCIMPGIIMLILQRDDVPDCILWSAVSLYVVKYRIHSKTIRNSILSKFRRFSDYSSCIFQIIYAYAAIFEATYGYLFHILLRR